MFWCVSEEYPCNFSAEICIIFSTHYYLLISVDDSHILYQGRKEKNQITKVGIFSSKKAHTSYGWSWHILLSLFLLRYCNKTHEWMVWWILIYLHSFGQGPSIIKVLFDWTSDGKGFLKNPTKTWNPTVWNPLLDFSI